MEKMRPFVDDIDSFVTEKRAKHVNLFNFSINCRVKNGITDVIVVKSFRSVKKKHLRKHILGLNISLIRASWPREAATQDRQLAAIHMH